MERELQFLIMVNSKLDLDQFIACIKDNWPHIHWVGSRSFDVANNWVQISENEEFDPSLASNPEKGFLHYRYRLEVSPVEGTPSLDNQIELARSLKAGLEKLGFEAVVCADFEDLL